jgi:hypothetical protein
MVQQICTTWDGEKMLKDIFGNKETGKMRTSSLAIPSSQSEWCCSIGVAVNMHVAEDTGIAIGSLGGYSGALLRSSD